jgi:hypothetical protein
MIFPHSNDLSIGKTPMIYKVKMGDAGFEPATSTV